MSRSRFTLPIVLCASAVFFLIFHERYLSGADPANFALAIKFGYSVVQDRPHAPGYPGFYLIWKGIALLTHF
ncbi:MAG TPA: hypothetical protein VGM92_11070, partial [Candidatus Kapabacteria bacterium]